MTTKREAYLRGVMFMVLGSLCLGLFGVFSRNGVELSSLSTAVFARFFLPGVIGIIPWVFILSLKGNYSWAKPFHGPLYIPCLRAIVVVGAHYAFFACVTRMPLVDAVLLFNTAPLFIPIIERVFFKQSTSLRVRLCLTVAFVGVAFIMKPTSGLINPYALLGLCAGAGLAISQICLLKGTRYYSMFENMLHLYLFSSVVALVPLFFFGPGLIVVGQEFAGGAFLIAFSALAISSLGNQFFRTLALGCVDQAGVLAPYMYLSVVFSGVLGWLLWGQVPDTWSVIGIALVLAQGLFLMVPPRVWLGVRSFTGIFR